MRLCERKASREDQEKKGVGDSKAKLRFTGEDSRRAGKGVLELKSAHCRSHVAFVTKLPC